MRKMVLLWAAALVLAPGALADDPCVTCHRRSHPTS